MLTKDNFINEHMSQSILTCISVATIALKSDMHARTHTHAWIHTLSHHRF